MAVGFLVVQSGGGGGSDSSGADLTFEEEIYVTRDGDTLESVSQLLVVDESALADTNGLSTSDALQVGTRLDVPDDPPTTATTPPELAQVEDADQVAEQIERWSDEYGVEPALMKGLAWEESRWDNSEVSGAGAVGIGQLLPETASYVANDLLDDATLSLENQDDNIQMSTRYLAYLLQLNDGDWGAALASYNQGPTSVRRSGWSSAATEYVQNVMTYTRGFQAESSS